MTNQLDNLDLLENVDQLEDLSDELDDISLEGFGEVNEDIDLPHIKISSKELKNFLTVAKQVSVASGKDFVSKAVAFEVEGDIVKAYASDYDVFVECSLELLNTENVLKAPLIIPIDVMIKLVKAVPANTILFEEEGVYKIRLVGGDMPFDTYNTDIARFKFKDPVVKKTSIESQDLYNILGDFGGIITQSIAPSERRILCTETHAYAQHLWSAVSCSKPFSAMDFKMKDINVLRPLLSQKEETLEVFQTEDEVPTVRKVISGKKFKYAFLIATSKVPKAITDILSKVEQTDGVYVDFVQLYKMAQLVSELPSSLGKVGFNYDSEGNVIMTAKMKNNKGKDAEFTLAGNTEGTVEPLSSEVVVQAKLLKIILRSFSKCNSVKLIITDQALGIEYDSYKAAVMLEQK